MKKIIDLRQNQPTKLPEEQPETSQTPPAFNFPETQENADSKRQISWSGPLYYHNPDLKAVWMVFGIFMVLAVLFQIFQKNFITTVLMALIGIMIVVFAKKKPAGESQISINPLGVNIDGKMRGYKEIKSFWIDYRPEASVEELSLQLKKWYMPHLKILIAGQNPVQLRSFLIQFIPEAEHEESLGETIARRLGL